MNINNQSLMSVRIDDVQIDSGKVWIIQDGREVCEMVVSVVPEMPQDLDIFHYHDLSPVAPFKIDVAIDIARHEEQLPQDCFSRSETVIPNRIEVGLSSSKLRFLKPLLASEPSVQPFEEEASLRENPLIQSLETDGSWFSPFISFAHAQSLDITYEDLVSRLGSENPDLRIDSRRFLGDNFGDFAGAAIADLSNPNNAENADLLTSLLHGINQGIRVADPSLEAAPGRNLDRDALPFMGSEDLSRVVELTGHNDASVRKQARRFIQSFPVDAFEAEIGQIVAANSGGCSTTAESWQTYASVYFYYNRLIQEGLNTPLDPERALIWDNRADEIQNVVTACMPDSQFAVDAALLDYGRATTYTWSNQISNNAAVEAANDFLEYVGDQQSDYYRAQHVITMMGVSRGQ